MSTIKLLSYECHKEPFMMKSQHWFRCHQATSHYLNQCWHRSMSPYAVTRPQWVNTYEAWKFYTEIRTVWKIIRYHNSFRILATKILFYKLNWEVYFWWCKTCFLNYEQHFYFGHDFLVACFFWLKSPLCIMVSRHGNDFLTTGPLCGESPLFWCISPLTKDSNMELLCFCCCCP